MCSSSNMLTVGLLTALSLSIVLCNVQPPVLNPNILSQSKHIGDCQACRVFIESFQKGLKRTERGNFEGGDAAWEREKLKKKYSNSEARLVDIQDGICKENEFSTKCHHMAEKAEEYIEEWWARGEINADDLFQFICIDRLKVCCPKHHFGKDCSPCQGDLNKLCNGNGKCRGDGTRKGNGTCLCDTGYKGEHCDQCASGFYVSYQDNEKLLCSPCHHSCAGDCRHGTQKDCVACKTGFQFDMTEGCIDINECDNQNQCTKDEFCMNSIGSFLCTPCNKGCKGCYSDGLDSCIRCAPGYSLKDHLCIEDRVEEYSEDNLNYARYMTYLGLIITAGILLPSNTMLGGVIGATVMSYIIGAEYYFLINGHPGLIDLKDYDLTQWFRV